MTSDNSKYDLRRRNLKWLGRIAVLPAMLWSVQAALGQTSMPVPSGQQNVLNIPPPAANTFQSLPSSLRFSSTGQLYASDGAAIWEQIGGSSGNFVQVGIIPSAGSDPGAINFSQDGRTILVSNGGGGPSFNNPAVNGNLYTLPTPGATIGSPVPTATLVGNIPNNFDFVPVPAASTMADAAHKFFVDAGTGSTSGVDVFDYATGSVIPLIENIPGASASLAYDPLNNELYVANGSPATNQPVFEEFNLTTLDNATSPLDWTAGTPIPGFTSSDPGEIVGGGMFFDSQGNLFTGASDGVLEITPSGSSSLFNSSTDPFFFASVVSDPAADGTPDPFLLSGFNSGFGLIQPMIFSAADFVVPVPEPSAVVALMSGGLMMLFWRRRVRQAKATG